MTSTERTIREIARSQAQAYYKSEEAPNPPATVVESVFSLVIAIIVIQLTRAGLSEEEINNLQDVPETIAQEMKAVGWNLEAIGVYMSTD